LLYTVPVPAVLGAELTSLFETVFAFEELPADPLLPPSVPGTAALVVVPEACWIVVPC
jgi:hypothetical protein